MRLANNSYAVADFALDLADLDAAIGAASAQRDLAAKLLADEMRKSAFLSADQKAQVDKRVALIDIKMRAASIGA